MNLFGRARAAVSGAAEAASTSTLELKTASYRWVPCVMIGAIRDKYTKKFLKRKVTVTGHRLELITLPGARPKGKAAVKAFKRAKQRQTEKGQKKIWVRQWIRSLPRYRGSDRVQVGVVMQRMVKEPMNVEILNTIQRIVTPEGSLTAMKVTA